MSLYIESYGEKLYLVKGKDSYNHKDKLKSLGCNWNSEIKAWSFPVSKKEKIVEYIEENGGETTVKTSKNIVATNNNSKEFVSKKDFLAALSRIERLETLVGQILGVDKKVDVPKVFEIKKQKEENKEEKKKEKMEMEEEDEKPKRLLRKKN